MNDSKKNFIGSDWSAYTPFELLWLEIILTKGVLAEHDVKKLADAVQLHFPSPVPASEVGNALINDIPKEVLLPAVKKALQKYDVLTFEESMHICDVLLHKDHEILDRFLIQFPEAKVVAAIFKQEYAAAPQRDKLLRQRYTSLILEQLLRISRVKALDIFKEQEPPSNLGSLA